MPLTGRLSRLASSLVLPSSAEQLYRINLDCCTMFFLSACRALTLLIQLAKFSNAGQGNRNCVCRLKKKEHNFYTKE